MTTTIDIEKINALASKINKEKLSGQGVETLFAELDAKFEADKIKSISDKITNLTPEDFASSQGQRSWQGNQTPS